MNKKIILLTIFYIMGNMWGLYFNKNIAPFFVIIWIVWLCFSKNKKFVFLLLCIVIMSCCRAVIKNNQFIQINTSGEEMIVEGIIIDVQNDGKYMIELSKVNERKIQFKARMRMYSKSCNSKVGENVRIEGKYSEGVYVRNEGTFDYKRYQQSKLVVRIYKSR